MFVVIRCSDVPALRIHRASGVFNDAFGRSSFTSIIRPDGKDVSDKVGDDVLSTHAVDSIIFLAYSILDVFVSFFRRLFALCGDDDDTVFILFRKIAPRSRKRTLYHHRVSIVL